jgi:hypothetical protein
MLKTIESVKQSQLNNLQIPIAQPKTITNIDCDPAVSSTEHYPTPANNTDAIGEALLNGRHLIILNKSGSSGVPMKTAVLNGQSRKV